MSADLALRVQSDPDAFRDDLLAWLPDAPPEEVVATRDQLVDIAAAVRRRQPAVMREMLRAARLTEWEMARRWPARDGGGARGDDRPTLHASKVASDVAWQRVYAVGRVDRDWLLAATEPSDLTQAAVIKRAAVAGIAATPAPAIDTAERFDVIYADPPWQYANSPYRGDPGNHYPTMPLDDICALDVPAADDAVLYLWATAPLLPEALCVMDSWGFAYKTGAVWDKDKVGVGYWFRGQHEHLLVGVRGKVAPPPQRLRVPSVYREARGAHSRKPDRVRDLIAAWFPEARRLEMFARRPAPGWTAWGNEVDASLAGMPAARWDPDDPEVTGQPRLYEEVGA